MAEKIKSQTCVNSTNETDYKSPKAPEDCSGL